MNPDMGTGMWWADGHRFVSWAAPSIEVIKNTKEAIEGARVPRISGSCTYVRGHGGVKRSVVFVHARLQTLPFIARFDIRSYYERMNHGVLNRIIADAAWSPAAACLHYWGLFISAHLMLQWNTYMSITISTTSVTPTTSSSWREPDSCYDGRSPACTRSSPNFTYRFIPTKDSSDGQKGGVIFWVLCCTRTTTLSLHR